MTTSHINRIRGVQRLVSSRVLGQESPVAVVSALACHWLAGVLEKAPRILLLGPTGVGKTECALALSEALHDREPTRIDMSEHSSESSLGVLLGNRSRDKGVLHQRLAEAKGSLLLLDEMEKAHARVSDLLLQMLEPGHVTTAGGFKLDLVSVPIICTSNVATAALTDVQRLSAQAMEDHVVAQARQEIRQEILNRFDAILVFQPLGLAAQERILRLQLDQYLAWLAVGGIHVRSTPEAERWLMMRGFDQHWGARSLRRAIRFHIGQAVVEALLRDQPSSGVLVVEEQRLRLESTRA